MASRLEVDTAVTVAGAYSVPVDTASITFVCSGADGTIATATGGNTYPLFNRQHLVFNSDNEDQSCVLSGASVYLDPNGGTIYILRTLRGDY